MKKLGEFVRLLLVLEAGSIPCEGESSRGGLNSRNSPEWGGTVDSRNYRRGRKSLNSAGSPIRLILSDRTNRVYQYSPCIPQENHGNLI